MFILKCLPERFSWSLRETKITLKNVYQGGYAVVITTNNRYGQRCCPEDVAMSRDHGILCNWQIPSSLECKKSLIAPSDHPL